MKPEDLKPPVPRTEYRIMIDDRVWYVPSRASNGEEFIFPGWNSPLMFNNDNPICIEYCSGNGAWIAKKAMENPTLNWVAVEMKFERVRKVWAKIKNLNLPNLLVLCGEGCQATQRYFPSSSVHDVFINFPDPWPKKRHTKHRLIQPEFVAQLWRILKPERSITFVTDDIAYSEWFIEKIHGQQGFSSSLPNPFYITEHSEYGSSYFDELWRSKGRAIRYHHFYKEEH